MMESLKEPLVLIQENEEKLKFPILQTMEKDSFMEEMKKVIGISMPMMVVSLSNYLIRVISLAMMGHVGQLALSSASIANSFTNVTGFSLILGMACALETLCGQAYGAQHYQRLGTYTYGAIINLFLACLPISILWIYTHKLLLFLGQDSLISSEAGKFSIWLIPALFAYAIIQSLIRYLQTQGLIFPMIWSSITCLCIHIPLCWTLIFKLNLGNAGASISVAISYWLNAIILLLYVEYSPMLNKTRISFSKDVFLTMPEFFKFAIPSALMVSLEWWAFEVAILLGGILPNPQLETSVLTICYTITSFHYLIQHPFAVAASTRVSHELGAGRAHAARFAVCVVLALSVAEFVVASTILFFCRDVFGYAFSNDKGVADYITTITPLLCISIIVDSIQIVLSGVARGSGWQNIGAYVNLGAYYLVGIPLALLLGFVLRLKGEGLWSGLLAGATMQSALLALITCKIDWENQATKVRRRILTGSTSTCDQLL